MARNHIIRTAHNTGLNDGLRIGARLPAYYEALARGGVGLMIMGSTSIHTSSNSRLKPAFAYWDDSVIQEYARLAEPSKPLGAELRPAQPRRCRRRDGWGSRLPACPLAIESELSPEMPPELEPEQIAEPVNCFAAAAVRVRAGEMHRVKIHDRHGNLIQEFLSPLTNVHEDECGGSVENRMRFATQIIRAVRRPVGTRCSAV